MFDFIFSQKLPPAPPAAGAEGLVPDLEKKISNSPWMAWLRSGANPQSHRVAGRYSQTAGGLIPGLQGFFHAGRQRAGLLDQFAEPPPPPPP